MKMLAIIICVKNEAGNIVSLLSQIKMLNMHGWHVFLIDGNSEDNTTVLARKSLDAANLSIITQVGNGYADAALAGLRSAYEQNYDLFVTMDADLSHDPKILPQIVSQLERGTKMVVGSRYTPGGSIVGWSLGRRLLSGAGNQFFRYASSTKIRDLTSGFVGYHRSAVGSILSMNTNARGYYFLTETKIIHERSGASYCEVPIVFVDRVAGKSKMNLAIIIESALSLHRLMRRK
jgi:dolichol-phosphate mannosyltransferase